MFQPPKLLKIPCVYLITSNLLPDLYKIGLSTNVESRLKSFHTAIPGIITLKHIQYYQDIRGMRIGERLIHYSLNKYRVTQNKEWFQTDDIEIFVKEMNRLTDIVNLISK